MEVNPTNTKKEQRPASQYKKMKNALALVDLSKTESRTFPVFSKDKLRAYLKNPKANENNLRALSQFLYRMSHQYRRLINYYAEMIDLTAYSIVPLVDITKKANDTSILKSYHTTALQLEKMNLSSEILKCLLIAWREDAFFGYTYEDDKSFFILPLDGTYCKISSVNFDGSFNFAFDFSYFRTHMA